MEALCPDDWQFYCGGDGLQELAWSCDMNLAAHIIDAPLRCGETGATYLPALQRYILVAWNYIGDPRLDTQKTVSTFFEAEHPWGPWSEVSDFLNDPQGFYCPRILSEFQSVNKDGQLEAVLVTGGDYYPSEFYKFTVIPVTLRAGGKFEKPAPPHTVIIGCEQTAGQSGAFTYFGDWHLQRTIPKAQNACVRFSVTAKDRCELRFTGTNVKLYATMGDIFGIAQVSLDGRPAKEVDLWSFALSYQHHRMVFDSGALSLSEHTLVFEVTGEKNKKAKRAVVNIDCALIET